MYESISTHVLEHEHTHACKSKPLSYTLAVCGHVLKQGLCGDALKQGLCGDALKQGLCGDALKQGLCGDALKQGLCGDALLSQAGMRRRPLRNPLLAAGRLEPLF